ncbi:hypothetical protein WICMUC_002142 [Wickerhamomyces mucosus]|uniref:Bile pigment transporter 1 n=1 Tax=Wickerhamomyces mucosus TaxID=1378264 RepID=A0A9P8TF39_9ASCO|nr:hypothetical protein WICMUC_002142 [Wickerhamomyces mucosus]
MNGILEKCPYGHSILIPRENAVNPCFFELVILANSVILFIPGSIQLLDLIKTPSFGKIRYSKLSKSSLWRVVFVFLQALLFGSKYTEPFFYINAFALLFIALPLTYYENFKKPTTRGSLLFYFLFQSIILGFSILQNLFTVFQTASNDPILYLSFINILQIFISSLVYYTPSVEVSKYYLEKDIIQANILSQITFSWMNELIDKGYRNQRITDADIPNPPAMLDTKQGYTKLKKVWDAQKKKSLLLALIKVFGLTVISAVSYELLDDILSFVQPQILKYLIQYFNNDQPAIVGFLLAGGLFVVSVVTTSLYNKFFILIFEVGLGTKAALMTLVYHKALKLSPESKKNRSTGDIVNLMSVDVSRVQDLASQFQTLVSAPIKLILCILSLYSLLGNATFAGIAAMAILVPINTLVSRRLKKLHKTQMKYKDMRTRATSEFLLNIKSIKLYAIEKAILERLNHVRNELELGNLRRIGIFAAFMNFSWYCVPFFVSCSTFTAFALLMKKPLTPDIIFPALALFELLSEPIYAIPSIITSLIETSVAFERITSFLLSDEIDEELIKHFERVERSNGSAINVENCTFLWETVKIEKDDKKGYDEESSIQNLKIALKIDKFEAKKGELTCIVGRIGSGKSTFLQSILGYLPCIGSDSTKKPLIEKYGSIAYCSQVPWIMNATVKENILFGHRFDEEFYQKTIEACELSPDLEILPDGDDTHVGEKGISLSGGQKARLSLARAVYSRADIYLLDDVLSAVDSHVAKNITNKVINGLLSSKSVILATNSIPVLSHASNIILLEKGIIVETGKFKNVVSKDTKLGKLIKEFGNASEEDLESTEVERENSLISFRRASIASFKKPTLVEKTRKTGQDDEKAAVGKVNLKVYKSYAKACGIFGVIGFLSLLMLSTTFSLTANYWLKNWSEDNERNGTNKHVLRYVAVYSFFGLGSGFFTLGRTIFMWVFCAIRSSTVLHNNMAKSVLRAPMSYFETTPIGRIMNRFSSDMNKIDERLPKVFAGLFASTIRTVFTLGFIAVNMPSFFIVVLVLSMIYIFYQRYYVATSRDLKRIVSISRSPIFSHLQESLAGFETVLAYDQADRFHFLHYCNLDFNLKSLYLFRSINRWLSVRLQMIGSIIIFFAATLSITNGLTAGMAGLVISYALRVTSSLNWIVRMTVEVETNIVSVERVLDYSELKPEAAEITDTRPPEDWPSHGSIQFDHYSTKYRKNLDLVLNDISLKINPKEKIGIVGRTGAGKSSLALAIFRMIEPVDGRIYIDGLNTSDIGLHDLRSNLAIIPQDSQAFEGTVRQNLDPLEIYSDDKLWNALELAHLKSFIENLGNDHDEDTLKSGLEAKLSEGGSNMSVGQRQLLCLAKALLNPSNVLILDEATASVDVETDKIVQETIRKAFSDRTILTIAHRIDTVLDSDRIVVLEKGQIKEFDTPENLLKDKDGLFYHLCLQGGYVKQT